MDRDTDLIPSSPSISSVSSSDLDTESTGSFFPDRSTTLGTLMGVNFPVASVRPARDPSRRDRTDGGGMKPKAKPKAKPAEKQRRRRRGSGGSWWRLCRDDMGPTSLGDFLQVERRMGGGADVADGHFIYCGNGGGGGAAEHEAVGGGPLFEDGRVLPPPTEATAAARRRQRGGEPAGRLPVLIAGICSGGEG